MKKKYSIKALVKSELPFFLSSPAFLWQLLFFCLPLLIILYTSFLAEGDGGKWYDITWQHFTIFLDPLYMRIIGRSLLLATFTVTACFFLAYPVVYFLVFYVFRWRNVLLFLLALPFWTNFLIQVYAWFFLLDRNGLINIVLLKLKLISQPLHLSNNIFSIAIVMVYCYVPFMVMPIYTVMQRMDKTLCEASSDLGARPLQTFFRITFPLSLSGVKTGILLVFVPAFGEFAIPALVGGSKNMVAGSLISYFFLIARNKVLGASFTIFSGLFLLICMLLFHWVFPLPLHHKKDG